MSLIWNGQERCADSTEHVVRREKKAAYQFSGVGETDVPLSARGDRSRRRVDPMDGNSY